MADRTVLTKGELLGLRSSKLMTEGDSYWPRWFRNIMAEVITKIESKTEVESHKLGLRRLKDLLTRPYIPVEDKRKMCRLYHWFIKQCDTLEITDIPDISSENPFSFSDPSEMFVSASGRLVPSLRKAVAAIYAELEIPLTYSVYRDLEIPLVLFAPESKVEALRGKLPANFNSFCEIEARTMGQAKLDVMYVDDIRERGSSSLFLKNDTEIFGITAAHVIDPDRGNLTDIRFLPERSIDVAIIRVPPNSTNVVPYSYPLRFQDYAEWCHKKSIPYRVYKIGTQTGLTVGTLSVKIADGKPILERRNVPMPHINRSYEEMVVIKWDLIRRNEFITFAVSGDSGATIFGMCNGLYHPLGIHCASVSEGAMYRESYAAELDDNLSALTEALSRYRLCVNGYAYANPPHAKTVRNVVDAPNSESDASVDIGSLLE